MEDDFIGELEGGVAPEEDTSRNAYGASPVFGLDPVHEVRGRGGGRQLLCKGGGAREQRLQCLRWWPVDGVVGPLERWRISDGFALPPSPPLPQDLLDDELARASICEEVIGASLMVSRFSRDCLERIRIAASASDAPQV